MRSGLLARTHAIEFLQVAAGGEAAVAGATDHRRDQIVTPRGAFKTLAQLTEHRLAERVALGRPVDGDFEQALIIGHIEKLVGHRAMHSTLCGARHGARMNQNAKLARLAAR